MSLGRKATTPADSRQQVPPFEAWLRQESPNWQWDWPHQRTIYPLLARITAGTLDRLAIVWPPRHCKTETVTIRYVAWRLIREPGLRVVIACYNQVLANKFSRKVRAIVRKYLPLSTEAAAVDNWESLAGGGLRAVGVGAGVTGQGFDLLVIDDPVKSREEADSLAYRERLYSWYRDDLYTRCEPGAAIVLIMTRWHEDDLQGRIMASDEAGEWTVAHLAAVCDVPSEDALGRALGQALCPDRYDEAALARIKRALGSRGFNALYQGRPSAAEGNLFKRQWWRYWYPAGQPAPPPVVVPLEDGTLFPCPQTALPDRKRLEIAQSWDCSFVDTETADYCVGQVWGFLGAEKYLLDQVRDHADAPGMMKMVRALSLAWPESNAKLIEESANGPTVIRSLRKEIGGLVAIKARGPKESRANAATPAVEAGDVYLPHPTLAPWVDAFVEECAAFPTGTNDDQVDAMAQMVNHRREREYRAEDWAPDEEREPETVAEYLARTGVRQRREQTYGPTREWDEEDDAEADEA